MKGKRDRQHWRLGEEQLTPVYWLRREAQIELPRLRELLPEYTGLRVAIMGRHWVVVGKRRASANPIPHRWTPCQVLRTRSGQVKVKLPGTLRRRSTKSAVRRRKR